MKRILAVIFSVAISGCTTTILENRAFKSYTVGQTKTATVGEAFLTDQAGSVQTVRRWVGVLNSPDGWQITPIPSVDFVRKELLYSGKSGSTIEIGYREYRGGYAAPAFYQAVKYDLNESKIIRFQRFTIEIIAANNQNITYIIIGD